MTGHFNRILPTVAFACGLVSACSIAPLGRPTPSAGYYPQIQYFVLDHPDHAQEIVLTAFGLLDTGYRFGGTNPEAGLDCSGMVSYVVEQVSGQRLPHNAAEIAAQTRPVPRSDMRPGDLVFFNTQNRPYSHMGIYLGDDKFIHAPSTRGRVRVENLTSTYFAKRFEGARTLLPNG